MVNKINATEPKKVGEFEITNSSTFLSPSLETRASSSASFGEFGELPEKETFSQQRTYESEAIPVVLDALSNSSKDETIKADWILGDGEDNGFSVADYELAIANLLRHGRIASKKNGREREYYLVQHQGGQQS